VLYFLLVAVCADVPFPLVDLIYHARPSGSPSTSSRQHDRVDN